MKNLLWILLLLCPLAATPAQDHATGTDTTTQAKTPVTSDKELVNMSADDYANLHLPALHVLMENARERSSQVNMFSSKKEYEERELKTIRRDWMRYLKFNGTFSYGTNDASSQIYYEDTHYPPVYNVSGTTQRWWNVGASVSIPLEGVLNRRNKIKQQQNRIDAIEYEVQSWHDEICMRIIDSYMAAVKYLAILEDLARSKIAAQTQYAATESDFMNGKADLIVLSRQKNVESDTLRQYEEARAELTKVLLQLEVLSKTPIISKPEEVPYQ